MADLDVSLRLRLVNMLSGPAKVAEKDLQRLLKSTGRRVGNRSTDRYARDIERVGRAAKGASRDVEKLGQASGKMRDAGGRFVAAATGARRLGDEARRSTRDVERLAAATRKVKAPAAGGGRQRDARGRFVGKGGGAAGGLGAGEAALGGAAAARLAGGGLMRMLPGLAGGAAALVSGKDQLDWGKTVFELEKATDSTGPKLQQYIKTVEQMALATGKSRTELAAMMIAAAKAGRPTQDLTRFTRFASAATMAWGTSAEETGQSLAVIGNIYKASQQRIEEIADAVNHAADKTAAGESDLLQFMQRASKMSIPLKISAEQLLAFGATFKEVGVQTEVAATGMDALLRKLATAELDDEDLGAGLKALGMNIKKMKKDLGKDAVGTIVRMFEAIGKIKDPLKQLEVLTKLGGGEYADDFAGLANNVENLKKNLALMADTKAYRGSVLQQSLKALEYDYVKVERAMEAIKRAGTTIMTPVVQGVGSMAEEFNKFAEAAANGETAFNRWASYIEGRYPGLIAQAKSFAEAAIDAADPLRALRKLGGQLGRGDETAEQARARGASDRRRSDEEAAIAERDRQRAVPGRLREQADNALRYGSGRSKRTMAGKLLNDANDADLALEHSEEVVRRIQQYRASVVKEVSLLQKAFAGAELRGSFGFGQGGSKGGDSLTGGGIIGGANAFPLMAANIEKVGMATTGVQKALDAAAAAAGTLEGELSKDLSGAAEKSMGGFNAALAAQGDKAVATAQRIKSQIEAILGSISATPTIAPRLSAPPAAGGLGKQSSAAPRSRGGISIAKVEITGVRDMASLERQLTTAADRKARQSFAGALHDTETA